MGTLTTGALTMADWAKRLDPDGKTPMIVEMLSQSNEILPDMLYIEGNLPTGHRSTVRTSLPTPAWRLINQGTAPSKSTTAQVDEACAMLDAWSEVDVELAKLGGNASAFRLSEASSFIEAMGQEHAQTLIYGNVGTAPEEFTGLAARYNSLSGTNAQNIISGSGSASVNSSVWLVGWGANTIHGIFPKGSKAGIEHQDLGEVTVETTAGIAGNRMRAYQDHFILKTGLAVKDWRYAVRIANIDITNLTTESSDADLIKLMIKAMYRIPNLSGAKFGFYMNRTCLEYLDIQARAAVQAGGGLVYERVEGKPMMTFRGIPVRKCDQLTETEATVS